MDETLLTKIAFTCVLLGIPLLYTTSLYADAGTFSVDEHSVTGRVVGVRQGPATTLYVEETRKVPVVIFDEIEIEEGVVVKITGEFSDGEFIADAITPHRIS